VDIDVAYFVYDLSNTSRLSLWILEFVYRVEYGIEVAFSIGKCNWDGGAVFMYTKSNHLIFEFVFNHVLILSYEEFPF